MAFKASMKFFFLIVFFSLLFIFKTSTIYASSYVLSYPSYMPGNILYKVRIVYEKISKYWYFGDFGQLAYNLALSDRYLVEAKTLFEYQQYFLADDSLVKSDYYFKFLSGNLESAQVHGKNIKDKKNLIRQASLKHIEVLNKIRNEVPESFVWMDEKKPPVNLHLHSDLSNSSKIRENIL